MLYGDNQASIVIALNPVANTRSKQIDIRFHYVRDLVERESIRIEHVPSLSMAADGLTKPLTPVMFERFIGLLGLVTRPLVNNTSLLIRNCHTRFSPLNSHSLPTCSLLSLITSPWSLLSSPQTLPPPGMPKQYTSKGKNSLQPVIDVFDLSGRAFDSSTPILSSPGLIPILSRNATSALELERDVHTLVQSTRTQPPTLFMSQAISPRRRAIRSLNLKKKKGLQLLHLHQPKGSNSGGPLWYWRKQRRR